MRKLILTVLTAGLLLGLLWVTNLIWFKPLNIEHFYSRVFLELALKSPELLSRIRLLEQYGITFHQDELDDASLAATEKQFRKLQEDLATLRSYDKKSLSREQTLSYDIAEWLLAQQLEGERWQLHNYPVNQVFGVQSNFPSFMDTAHQVKTREEADDYVARLGKVGIKFAQVMEGLKAREGRGIIPPTFVIDKVLAEMRGFVATKPEDNILYVSLKKKLNEAASLSTQEKDTILADTRQQILSVVYPAYQNLISYFAALKPRSTEDAGVWKLPDGEAYYAYILSVHTSTKDTPDQIHQIGLSEVERIQNEMRSILAAQGYDVSPPLGSLMKALGDEPRFLYADTAEGRAQILTDYQTIIDEVNRGLGAYFPSFPKAGVKVERVPEFKEMTAPGAYYNPPAMDGSRPGIFYANLWDIKATPKFDMRTLAYHEAVPGHHFQLALAQELKDVPIFRRLGGFTAYAEGWALYAEQLAWEAGFLANPFDNLGRLQAELFRAVRLVVDTGLHAKRWTREKAIDYMLHNTGMAESDVVAEVERYIVMPGQACAYKIGMLKILELRTRAQQRLGSRFDIRIFHDVVLKNGALPLPILERIVGEWIVQAGDPSPAKER